MQFSELKAQNQLRLLEKCQSRNYSQQKVVELD